MIFSHSKFTILSLTIRSISAKSTEDEADTSTGKIPAVWTNERTNNNNKHTQVFVGYYVKKKKKTIGRKEAEK